MLKVSYAGCLSLSLVISAQFAPEMCFTAKNSQKIHKKPLFCCSKSSKVIAFGDNQKPVKDFLLMISDSAQFLRYSDLLAKSRKFSHPSHI